MRKFKLPSNWCYLAFNVWADNHEISDRALTNIIMDASAVDQGVDINECAVTVMSTNRKRKKHFAIPQHHKIVFIRNHFLLIHFRLLAKETLIFKL